MVGALTTAAAGMEAQQNMMDALSNDIANVNTTGYKSQRVGFRSLLYQAPGRGAPASQDALPPSSALRRGTRPISFR